MADDDGEDRRLERVQDEVRTELRLLHERVNALLSAEAFLTIAYTATKGNGSAWADVVAPVLCLLGLVLALLAHPGVSATARLVLERTAESARLQPHGIASGGRSDEPQRSQSDQRRSLLFFRGVPVLFAVVWVGFLAASLLLAS